MLYCVRRRQRGRAARDAVLRDVRQPRHLPQGLDRGDPAQHALDRGGDQLPAFDDDVWELYDTTTTGPRRTTSPKENPEKLARAAAALADRGDASTTCCRWTTAASSASTPTSPGRPTLIQGNSQLLFGGMGRLTENSVVSIKNKSHSVTAEVEVPDGGAQGVIIAQGGSFGGWSLYAKDGKLKYCYNFFGIEHFYVDGDRRRFRPASTRCGWSSPTTAAAWARAATVTLYVDGEKVGEGRVERTAPMVFSADETCDVGEDGGSPVSPDYGPHGNAFTGEVNWVQIDIAERRGRRPPDHARGALRVAMARQ